MSPRRSVWVGSVGTVCSVLLLMGDSDVEDPLFLQLKEAGPSALEPYVGASRYPNHAERSGQGQHLIQEASDEFLGVELVGLSRLLPSSVEGHEILERHHDPRAESVRRPGGIVRDRARPSPRTLGIWPSSAATSATGIRFRTRAVARFAEAYADQTERDYRGLLKAIRQGRLTARVDLQSGAGVRTAGAPSERCIEAGPTEGRR